jgi:hypothetical protein
MIGALLYLRLTSLRNSFVARIKRLKQPKYLFGALAGAAYFWFLVLGHIGGSSRSAHRAAMAQAAQDALPATLGGASPLIGSLAALAFFGFVLLTWLVPTQKPGLGFSEAETAFLFPAPISRRMLINFKLLSSQFAILFTSLFFALLSNRWSTTGGNALTHSLGWWAILSTLNLHSTAAALTLIRLIEGGMSTARRRTIVLAGVGLAIAATVAWVWRDLAAPTAEDVSGVGPLTHYLLTILNGGALRWLLWPFRLVLAPFFATDTPEFLLTFGPALLVIAAHYAWVMRMEEVSFEEAALTAAEKRTALIAQARAGTYRLGGAKAKARRGPFRLADTGWPEFAFLWKNLLSTRPYFNLRTLAVLAVIILAGSRWMQSNSEVAQGLRIVVPIISLMVGVYVMLLGPHLARQDLRSDLICADILKTYPIRGWRLVLGELLTPVAILTGLVWLALLAATLAFTPTGSLAQSFPPALQVTCAVAVAAIAPPLITLQLLVLNGATVVFPGWFQTSRTQAGGIEMMGQRLIFLFGNLIVIFTALLPAAAFGGLLIFVTQWLIGGLAAIIFATVAVLAVLIGEVWCGLWWLGERFEKFDLSAELRP